MGFEVWKHQVSAEVQWNVLLAGVSVCTQPLCVTLWVQIPEWVHRSFLEVHKRTPPLVSETPFFEIRHLLLSLHFSRGFLYCLQEEQFPTRQPHFLGVGLN